MLCGRTPGAEMGETPASDGTNCTVFLSYSREDRARAVPIIEALQALGIDVWWDGLLKGGQRFANTTETALETANAVVVLWSNTSIESHWVRDEATRGRDRGCMISVSLDDSEPPLGFRQIQYIDFTRWRGDGNAACFHELLEAIETASAAPGVALSFAGQAKTRPGLSRRNAIGLAGASLVALGGGFAAWRAGLFGSSVSRNSIAVMAFENLNDDPEQAYFSDGLTEELRTTLSLNPQLDVMAQASSNSFRGKTASAQEIAKTLNVSSILEGSVLRAGERIRIIARLVDGENGFESWTKSIERDFDDILEVQREIATEVVDALLASLFADAKYTERIGGTKNAKAFDVFLKGSALYALAKDEATDRAALANFEEATRIDPEYAAAFAALSRANTVIASFYAKGEEPAAYYDRAMEYARKAIDLAPEMAEGHSALGFALTNGKLDLTGAREPFMRSYELGFGNAAILNNFAIFASNVGEFGDARRAIGRAKRLDPLNAAIYRTEAIVEFAARDFDAARKAARTALSYNEEIGTIYRLLGDMALVEGDFKAAHDYFRDEPGEMARLRGLALTESQLVGRPAGEALLASMAAKYGTNSLYQQAQVHAQWHETDKAIAALEAGMETGDSGMVLAKNDPLLDPIRQDPRFHAILSHLGLE